MENRLHAKLFGEKKIIRTFCGLRHNCINFQYLHDFYQYNIEKKDSSKRSKLLECLIIANT